MTSGLERRPLDARQVGAWAALLAAAEAVDHQEEHVSEQDLIGYLDDPDADYPRGSVAVYDGDLMIAFGLLFARTAAEPVHEMRLSGTVHPGYRGRGVGTDLLTWAERAAGPLHQERFPGQPMSLDGLYLARNSGAAELFSQHGYQPSRAFLRMSCDLTAGIAAGQVPAGVDIVGFTADRSEDARLVYNEAFRDHWGSTDFTTESWRHFIGSQAFRPVYSFLAYEGAVPLGLVLGHEYDSHAQATGQRELHVPTVGTRRVGRSRGIATALLTASLRAATADGLVSASLSVDSDSPTGAVGLYERVGFTTQDTWIVTRKALAG